MTYENRPKETTNADKESYIDGIVADDNGFGLTADDLRAIDDELYAMNHHQKEWSLD